jgi:hypothetical protein
MDPIRRCGWSQSPTRPAAVEEELLLLDILGGTK